MPDRTRWGAVFVLLIAGVIVALQIGKAAIALPALQRDLMLSLGVASWMVGAYGVLGAVAGLPAGIASSLFTARSALLWGLVAAGLGSLGGAFAESGRAFDREPRGGGLRVPGGDTGHSTAAAGGNSARRTRRSFCRCSEPICRPARC